MKLAVIGSRDFNDYKMLKRYLDYIHSKEQITLIISGGARGADKLSEKWADDNNIQKSIHLPDWDKYKKAAGFIRNTDIVNEADVVLALWNKVSRGTADSLRKTIALKKQLWVVDFTTGKIIDSEEVENCIQLFDS